MAIRLHADELVTQSTGHERKMLQGDPEGLLLTIAWCLTWLSLRDAETRVIDVAVSARSLAQVAHYVAEEKGYYRDEGLEVRLILMSTPIAARALIAGNAEFTGVSGGVLPAIVTGARLRFVFSAFYRPMFWLYSRPDIRDVTGLKGKNVAVSGLGSGPATRSWST